MRPIRAVVFDLDGTLCDSAPDIAAALNSTLVAAGLSAFDLATIKTMVGGGASVLVERALVACGEVPHAARVATVLADFLECYRAAPCRMTTLYPGAREVLNAFRGAGLALAICTNKPADLTEFVLTGLDVRSYFSSVVAASPGMPPKPAPDMLLKVLAELGVGAREAVMVGDSKADAGVARAAGVRCILLRQGYSAEPIEQLGADAVLSGFAELPDAIMAAG